MSLDRFRAVHSTQSLSFVGMKTVKIVSAALCNFSTLCTIVRFPLCHFVVELWIMSDLFRKLFTFTDKKTCIAATKLFHWTVEGKYAILLTTFLRMHSKSFSIRVCQLENFSLQNLVPRIGRTMTSSFFSALCRTLPNSNRVSWIEQLFSVRRIRSYNILYP